ncbi:uncharacterized protein MELLADRAFT_94000 [Melampsora larici-populina 98AG31]|uniref:Uncharacterized protein n=1 Tax=Melampsora larici-populina (strain 98AG31 / pathotype 3-4-7) TaxID=747676 RepID=F4S619_MELLP|nr:uncharacterized protein MELLADRAFT_94000 [Melampsora larici-populina 98AG31]EGF99857.1 hypothetical protein MELLADRAFT_94000 [Melampsora larici-populina 98AG31]
MLIYHHSKPFQSILHLHNLVYRHLESCEVDGSSRPVRDGIVNVDFVARSDARARAADFFWAKARCRATNLSALTSESA